MCKSNHEAKDHLLLITHWFIKSGPCFYHALSSLDYPKNLEIVCRRVDMTSEEWKEKMWSAIPMSIPLGLWKGHNSTTYEGLELPGWKLTGTIFLSHFVWSSTLTVDHRSSFLDFIEYMEGVSLFGVMSLCVHVIFAPFTFSCILYSSSVPLWLSGMLHGYRGYVPLYTQ